MTGLVPLPVNAETQVQPAANPQAAVRAFLASGTGFGSDDPPRRIEAHAASIFLVGDHAWKLKRAVRFRYIDFRHRPSDAIEVEAELRLHRRTTPEMYLVDFRQETVLSGDAIRFDNLGCVDEHLRKSSYFTGHGAHPHTRAKYPHDPVKASQEIEARHQDIAHRIASGDRIAAIQVSNQHARRDREVTRDLAMSREGRTR